MSYRRTSNWNPLEGLKGFALVLAKKIGWSALVWTVLYFASQPCRAVESPLTAFCLVIGSLAGAAIGWWMAEDAVENAGFSGMTLWVILVLASAAAVWSVEGVFLLIFGKKWMEFGGFMMAMSATVAALGTSVWRASADD